MFSNFSRRQILKTIGGFAAGAAVLGGIPLISKLFVSRVQAQTEGISTQRTTYKGVQIAINRGNTPILPLSQKLQQQYDNTLQLYIGRKQIDVVRNRATKRYQTYYLPNTDYESPLELAKDLIDFASF